MPIATPEQIQKFRSRQQVLKQLHRARDCDEKVLLERYVLKDTRAFNRYLAMQKDEPESRFELNVFTRVAAESVFFDAILPTRDLFIHVFVERMDMVLSLYCEMCDVNSLRYPHRKAMDFLPAALRAKVDGIPWTFPDADQGWFSDVGSYVPGTTVKL